MKKRLLLILTICIMVFGLTACGSKEKQNFISNLNIFCNNIQVVDYNINNINPKSTKAVENLIDQLDALAGCYSDFANLEFPKEYAGLKDTALEASDYMAVAVSYYKTAYEGEYYNEEYGNYAKDNYDRAYKRVQAIVKVIKGETKTVNVE